MTSSRYNHQSKLCDNNGGSQSLARKFETLPLVRGSHGNDMDFTVTEKQPSDQQAQITGSVSTFGSLLRRKGDPNV